MTGPPCHDIIRVSSGRGVTTIFTPEFFWYVFELTGSIEAYVVYRLLCGS